MWLKDFIVSFSYSGVLDDLNVNGCYRICELFPVILIVNEWPYVSGTELPVGTYDWNHKALSEGTPSHMELMFSVSE